MPKQPYPETIEGKVFRACWSAWQDAPAEVSDAEVHEALTKAEAAAAAVRRQFELTTGYPPPAAPGPQPQ